MGRRAKIAEAETISRLSSVFRDLGYEGATIAILANAVGVKQSSLYHRFPEGKEQMAREVLEAAALWLNTNILQRLEMPGRPSDKIQAMVEQLDLFYHGGRQACLLNMLATPQSVEGPISELIRSLFEAWQTALTRVFQDAGICEMGARARAERTIILLQGSLVLARGTGTDQPFKKLLDTLANELLAA